jgi:hypothetical protein
MMEQRTLIYPVFIVEKKAQKYAIFDIARRQSDFIIFSRLPPKVEYLEGKLFDSEGTVYDYLGSSGSPRFGPALKILLEALIVPSLMMKALASVVYFGPSLTTSKKVDISEYRDLIMTHLTRHTRPKERPQLRSLLDKASTYKEVIEAIDWWRFHGGERDEDGHLIRE